MAHRQPPPATLRLTLSQLNVTVGDLEGNRRRMMAVLREAEGRGTDLVVFPELAITGYPPEDLLLQRQFVSDNLVALRELATVTRRPAALVGFVDRDAKGRLYNAAGLLVDGRVGAVYHKQCLPNYGVFDEQRYFTPGAKPLVVELGRARLAINICEDIWRADGPLPAQAKAGANCAINLSASPYHAGKIRERERLLIGWVKRVRFPMVYVNLVGGQDELVFDGGSLVVDERGRIAARAPQFEEAVLPVELLLASRPRTATAAVRRIRLPSAGVHVESKRPPRQVHPHLERLEEVYHALTVGVRDYAGKNHFTTTVIGISGGIDSALVACLAADALGRQAVVGVVMPSRYSSAATQGDARAIAHALGIRCLDYSIEPIVAAYQVLLRPHLEGGDVGLAEQNLQARIRGNLLMALSNAFGWLVLTTGNKSELATGYCTLYGDMAGGFAALKDVPKLLVYELARWRNARQPVIPESVFERAPTAELAPNQTDQDTLPPYEQLDPILRAYIEDDLALRDIVRRLDHPEIVHRVIQMVDRAEYKRRQGPPGIKITPRAFGKDRRMPITNRYRVH